MKSSDSIARLRYRDIAGRRLEEIHPLLAEMLYRREAETCSGEVVPLRAEVSRTEMFALYDLILGMPSCNHTLEIGCAMGISSLVICAALQERGDGGCHIILDPLQRSHWRDTGRRTLERAGPTAFEIHDEASQVALPRLMEEGQEFDFVFQDGMHTFDHALLEFHYLDRILRKGGLVVYDDIDIWGMNRFIRYVSWYPHWSIERAIDRPAHSRRRKVIRTLQELLGIPLRLLPSSLALEFFSDSLIRSDRSLGLDASMIVLRKTGSDVRPFDWNVKF